LTFGKEPLQVISRNLQMEQVIADFSQEIPSQQAYMIVGVRGSGKTVFMSEIQKELKQSEEWITVELNPQRDMLKELMSKLCSEDKIAKLFQSAKINLSAFGFGLEVSGKAPVTDPEIAIDQMLAALGKKGKRLLITIDEVSNTPQMKEFASAFQIFVRNEHMIFLLMTGLYENINELQNEKSHTFLYRTPKLELKALNIGTIAQNYKLVLKVDDDRALDMAKTTRGYAFAFQVLGYFMWQFENDYDRAAVEFKQYLDEYVYDKIWSELSVKDKEVLAGVAGIPSGKISEIRAKLDMSTNQFNPYRDRLIKRGILNGEDRGYVSMRLPMFENYVIEHI